MAVAIAVRMPKQSERFAATLNSPPLTWMAHWVALRKGIVPGSRRCTMAPSERRSNSASLRIVSSGLVALVIEERHLTQACPDRPLLRPPRPIVVIPPRYTPDRRPGQAVLANREAGDRTRASLLALGEARHAALWSSVRLF